MSIIFYVPESNLERLKTNKQVKINLEGVDYYAPVLEINKTAEYTPEAVFSEHVKHRLVFKITVQVTPQLQSLLHPGQPVEIDYE